MKVAAYQVSLPATHSMAVLDLIREQIEWCESQGVEILCCPEGVLGGLADYVENPATIAIDVEAGQLERLLAPLASEWVTTILGFTEIAPDGRLYNSAAVYHKGSVIGIYRKWHPAINHSVYTAGTETPVFTVGTLTFGILICRDSLFAEPVKSMVAQGAVALFIPTNNGLPPTKAGSELVAYTRKVDSALATENNVAVIRADVAGRTEQLVSYGSSGIVAPNGVVLQTTHLLHPDLIMAEIETTPRG